MGRLAGQFDAEAHRRAGYLTAGNGNMVAIVMDSRDKVDAFHAKALELGGTNEGDPGFRGDPKFGYYFAYFRDPDGHKFAVFNIQPQGDG